MPKSLIEEDCRPLKLCFSDVSNLVIVPTIGDGNCYFHSVLRSFNTSYIKAKSNLERVNLARTFRNALADRLNETDPLTGQDYYSGLNNGNLEDFSKGVSEYTKEYLTRELKSSEPVDNIYQELISDAIKKDIYIIDGETNDMYSVGSSFKMYYKGRNSIIVYYTPGHYEVVGIKRKDGTIDTIFTPEHELIQICHERLLSSIRVDRKRNLSPKNTSPYQNQQHGGVLSPKYNRADTSPKLMSLRPISPKKIG
jgi:hypothetical protein